MKFGITYVPDDDGPKPFRLTFGDKTFRLDYQLVAKIYELADQAIEAYALDRGGTSDNWREEIDEL